MAPKAKVSQTQMFIKFISQQIELLKEGQRNLKDTVDDAFNQVQREVEAWVNGGGVNQATCAKMNHRIQQVISLFMAKTVEISDQELIENGSDSNETTLPYSIASTTTATSYAKEVVHEKTMSTREETGHTSGCDLSHSTNARFSILKDAVLSLKKTTVEIQEKQEHVIKRLDSLKNSNVKSKQKIEERLQVLEEANQEMSSNVDHLFETVINVDTRLTSLEEENKTVIVSMDELDNKISSIGTCSNDASMSVQDIRKDLDDINKKYGEMSDEMNRLQSSLHTISSHFTEELENIRRLRKDKVYEMVGLVCQLFSKRLVPLEKLNDTLNKNFVCSKECISKVEKINTEFTKISGKVAEMETQFNKPTIGFNASCNEEDMDTFFEFEIEHSPILAPFDSIFTNNGGHFNPRTGEFTAPLNGFYVISIDLSGQYSDSGSRKIICFQRKMPLRPASEVEICCASDNNCVAHLVKLKAGDIIYLSNDFKYKSKKPIGKIMLEFSCFMIKQ